MRRFIVTAVVSACLATAAIAQPAGPGPGQGPGQGWGQGQGWGPGYGGGRWSRMNPEERAARMDARLAAMKASLRLNADQERLWAPLEAAMREAMSQRYARMQAMREQRRSATPPNPVQGLRTASDLMAENAATLKKIAEAAEPFYAALDDAQKRRADGLFARGGRGMMRGQGWHGEGGGWGWGSGGGWGWGRPGR